MLRLAKTAILRRMTAYKTMIDLVGESDPGRPTLSLSRRHGPWFQCGTIALPVAPGYGECRGMEAMGWRNERGKPCKGAAVKGRQGGLPSVIRSEIGSGLPPGSDLR